MEEYKYLKIKGDNSTVQVLKSTLEECGLQCETIFTNCKEGLSFLNSEQLITLLVTLIGSGGIITTVLANRKHNKIKVRYEEDNATIEIECTDVDASDIAEIVVDLKNALTKENQKKL